MNRRSFLAGLGAAVAAVAVATRLGETKLAIAAADGMPLNAATHPYNYMIDRAGWFVREEDDLDIPRLSEESLEELEIELKRYRHSVSIMPTHVVWGTSS